MIRNKNMTLDASVREWVGEFDFSDGVNVPVCYDHTRDIIIQSITGYVTETCAADAIIDVGNVTDTDVHVTYQIATDVAAGATFTVTSQAIRHSAGEPLLVGNAASGGNGKAVISVKWVYDDVSLAKRQLP